MGYKVDYRGKRIDVDKVELRELKVIREQIQVEMDDITMQLNKAKAKAKAYGQYSDPDWYGRITKARRVKARQIQYLNVLISKKRKEKIKKETRALGDHFMDAARDTLGMKTFLMILDVARKARDEEIEQVTGG